MTARAPTLAIGGPTATGKTRLAVELALRTGAELVNADSRQLVRRLRVGTAAPTDAELRGVPCHLLDLCEPGEVFTVAQWLEAARCVLAALDRRRVRAIVVGGTGQYLRALREGWDFGGVAPEPGQREALTRAADTAAGRERLLAEIRRLDPEVATTIDAANPRRLVRAVERMRARGGSALALRRTGARPLALAVLDADAEVLDAALEVRMEAMFGNGAILAETAAELRRGTSVRALDRAGIGYREALAVLHGSHGVEAARAATLRRTRRYVKAQRTWFRHEPAMLRLQRTAGADEADLAGQVMLRWVGSPR